MARSENQKRKLLYIKDYLEKSARRDKPVSASVLCEMLQQDYDIPCERKSIYTDIQTLQDYGMDIECIPGKNGGYYLASRAFELPELQLLSDAVQSSRYLTEKKSRELVGKLCTLCSEEDARLLKREMVVSGRVKSMNESIYYNVDAIQEAISKNVQITFRYFDWGLQGERRYRNREYVASPYALCQDNENCYLLAHSARHGATSYRLDRMSDISLLNVRRLPCPELTGPALQTYVSRLFQMYSGEPVSVRMRFEKSLTNVVIDHFGPGRIFIPDGTDHFILAADVAVSPMFLSWMIGFGDKAEILSPDSVRQACADLCRQVLSQYQTTQKD